MFIPTGFLLLCLVAILIFLSAAIYRIKKEKKIRTEEFKNYIEKLETVSKMIEERKRGEEQEIQAKKEEIDFLVDEYQKAKIEEIDRLVDSLKERKIDEVKLLVAKEEILFEERKEEIEVEIGKAIERLNDFKEKIYTINETILREKEVLEKEDFYRINLDKNDKEDILNLEKVEPYLHNKEVLQKLIYSVFIQRPLNEMIKRVLGGQKVSGVYKITFKTGEAYIGKSVDVGKRWQEHVKSSLGIGTIASSSLHTKMKKEGIDFFSFELIEEVIKDKLNEREKYYINFFETDKQLNMKVG